MKKMLNIITILVVVTYIALWLLQCFGYTTYTILSDSMYPSLKTGDVVLVKEKTDVKEGDIIAIMLGDVVVVHRVEQITGQGVVTRGDANASADAGIRSYDSVIGQVVFNFGITQKLLFGNGKAVVIIVLIISNLLADMMCRKRVMS